MLGTIIPADQVKRINRFSMLTSEQQVFGTLRHQNHLQQKADQSRISEYQLDSLKISLYSDEVQTHNPITQAVPRPKNGTDYWYVLFLQHLVHQVEAHWFADVHGAKHGHGEEAGRVIGEVEEDELGGEVERAGEEEGAFAAQFFGQGGEEDSAYADAG